MATVSNLIAAVAEATGADINRIKAIARVLQIADMLPKASGRYYPQVDAGHAARLVLAAVTSPLTNISEVHETHFMGPRLTIDGKVRNLQLLAAIAEIIEYFRTKGHGKLSLPHGGPEITPQRVRIDLLIEADRAAMVEIDPTASIDAYPLKTVAVFRPPHSAAWYRSDKPAARLEIPGTCLERVAQLLNAPTSVMDE